MKCQDRMQEIIQHMIHHVIDSDIDQEKVVIAIEIVIEENVAIVTAQKKLQDPKGQSIEFNLEKQNSRNLLIFVDIVE